MENPTTPEHDGHDFPEVRARIHRNNNERGELIYDFASFLSSKEFSQYPRIKAAYDDCRRSLQELGLPLGQHGEVFDIVMKRVSETHKSTDSLTETSQRFHDEIVSVVQQKLNQQMDLPHVDLQPFTRKLQWLYVRMLEVLGGFQKQNRHHTASHRAASSKETAGEFAFGGPELSLEAMRGALQQGVRMIELDIVVTKDGIPVISHGLSTKTLKGTKRIAECTWDELRGVGATIDKTGAPLYPLALLLDEFDRYRGLSSLNIEIKDRAAVGPFVELIRKNNLETSVTVSAFDPLVLKAVHAELPRMRLGFNTSVTELNAPGFLDSDGKKKRQPMVLSLEWLTSGRYKGKYLLGGDTVPQSTNEETYFACFDALPSDVKDLLRETKGYISVQMPLAKAGLWMQPLATLKQRATEEGLDLVMHRVTEDQSRYLSKYLQGHTDQGETLTYKRLRT